MSKIKLEEFCIVINNEKKVYYPGETIQGEVTVMLKAEMKIIGLVIEFCGIVKTCWHEGAGEEKKTFSGEDVLFQYTTLLTGSLPDEPTAKKSITHPAGTFDYQYHFTFPNILPSSYEGTCGSIRYFLKAHIQKPGNKLDIITKFPLTVIDKIDTTEPIYTTVRQDEAMKNVGCFCLKSGQVFMTASIDRGCYLPGEIIAINAQVKNQSKKNMTALKAKIIQCIDYFSSDVTHRKSIQKELVKLKSSRIQRGQMFTWAGEKLHLPMTSPSIHNCQLISVRYNLLVYLDVPFASDVIIPFEITMGTMPGHVKVDEVLHSYKSIPSSCPVSFHDDQEEVYKITHEREYLPIYPCLREAKNITS